MDEKLQYLLIALLLFSTAAWSEPDDPSVEVTREQGNVYEFKLYFTVQASVEEVFAIFTDYKNIPKLNRSIKSSRLLESEEPGVTRVEIISKNCLLFFCKKLTRVEDVRINKNKSIETVVIPSMSNFKSGEAFWTFDQQGDKTIVTMQAKVVPDFWIPPFIGPRTLMKNIRRQLRRTAMTVNDLLTSHEDE